MTYTIKLTTEARTDIQETTKEYNLKKANLGNKLFIAIAEAIDLLESNPFLFQKRYKDIRKIPINQFQHAVYYFIENKEVIIIAVLHNARNPQTWKDR